MHLVAITSFIAGLIVVIVGAELIVRGGSRVGALLGVSPMVLGLTVVAIGTSTPELAVGLTAAAEGNGGLAVGNIAGTNIVNILLILGLSAWIMPRMLAQLPRFATMRASCVSTTIISRSPIPTTRRLSPWTSEFAESKSWTSPDVVFPETSFGETS